MMWAAALALGTVVAVATTATLWWSHAREEDPLPEDYQPPANKQIMDLVRVLRRVGGRSNAPGKHRRAA